MPLDIASILSQWEAVGVFDYVLPFLLLFAMIFGILSTTAAFGKNKGIHIVIALAVSLLALRLPFVSDFFREVFPRVGVGLAIILSLVILVAMFVPGDHAKGWMIGIYSLGGLIALIVVFNSFSALNWFGSNWWSDWGAWIIGGILIIGVIVAIAIPSGGSDPSAGSKWAGAGK